MRKTAFIVLTACWFSLLGADLRLYTGGDKAWTEEKGVWTCGDLSGTTSSNPKTWLELIVQGPCMVTFGMVSDYSDWPNAGNACGIGGLYFKMYLDGNRSGESEWRYSWTSGEGRDFLRNRLPVYDAGEHIIRWEVSSSDSSYYTHYRGQTVCKLKDIVVTPAPSNLSVRFHKNDGTPYSYLRSFSTTDGAYDDLPVPEREDCEFLGWFSEEIGGKRLEVGSRVLFDDPTDYYAHWSIPLEDALGVVDECGCGDSLISVWEDGESGDSWNRWHGIPDVSHDGWGAACVDATTASECGCEGPMRPSLGASVYGSGTFSFWWKTIGSASGSFWAYEEKSSDCEGWISSGIEYDSEVGDMVAPDGEWVQVSVNVYGDWEHEFCWEGARVTESLLPNSDRGGLLVDELAFTPAPESVRVSFDANGGIVSQSSAILATTGCYGELPTPTRKGWDFDGWFTEPFGGWRADAWTGIYFDKTVLYAHWSIPLEDALGITGDGSLAVSADWAWDSDDRAWSGTRIEPSDGEPFSTAATSRGRRGDLNVTAWGRGTLSFSWRGRCGTNDFAECMLYVPDSNLCAGERIHAQMLVSPDADTGWQTVSLDVREDREHQFRFESSGSGIGGEILLANLKWAPAPETIRVRFLTDKYVVWSEKSYDPGAQFGRAEDEGTCYMSYKPAVDDPTREGCVFTGWYLDPEFVEPLDWSTYVPFANTVFVYAKWEKPLAALSFDGVTFKNVAPTATDPWFGDLYPQTFWQAVDACYSDGRSEMQTNLGTDDGWSSFTTVSAAETTLGSGFLDLLWSIYPYSSDGWGYGAMTLYVDDKAVVSFDSWSDSDEPMRVGLGSGQHRVRIEATGYDAVVAVKDVKLTALTASRTLGEWLGRLRDYRYWTPNNLPAIKSACAMAQVKGTGTSDGYKAAVEHALATLLALGEDKLVGDTFKQLGFTLDLEMFSAAGLFDFSRAPACNTLVNAAVQKALPAIETALADLESVPEDWNGTLAFRADEYPLDENVDVDAGDILYLRAALKAVLAAAHWIKAYNVELDWTKADADVRGVKIPSATTLPTLASDKGWSTPVSFHASELKRERWFDNLWDSFDEVIQRGTPADSGRFRVARFGNRLLFRIEKTAFVTPGVDSIDIALDNGSIANHQDKHFSMRYVPSGIVVGDPLKDNNRKIFWFVPDLETIPDIECQEDDEALVVSIDLTGTELEKGDVAGYVRSLTVNTRELIDSDRRSRTYLTGTSRYHAVKSQIVRAVLDQGKVLDKVRDAGSLAKSKVFAVDSLRLAQKADDFILNHRTDSGVCLVNYDGLDEVELQAMREHIATALESLSAPQDIDWSKGLSGERIERVGYLDNPISVSAGALFGGKVVRGLVPGSLRSDVYAPCIDEMPDATLGGLLPLMSKSKWAEYAEAAGLEYRNDPFGVVEPEDAYELYPGEAVSIPVEVIDCGGKVSLTADSGTLPPGMKFSASGRLLTGTPTKPGTYSVAVTAKGATVTAVGRIGIVVHELPHVSVRLETNVAGCKVSGEGDYLVGKRVTLSATVPKGAVLLGWFTEDGEMWPDGASYRNSKLTVDMGRESLTLVARIKGEEMSVSCDGLSNTRFVVGVNSFASGIPVVATVESAVKSVSVSGLPSGMKYDAKTGKIVGIPSKSGDFTVKVKVTSTSGSVREETFAFSVESLPDAVADAFNGFAFDGPDEDSPRFGTFTLTATDAGKLTAKIVTSSGTSTFTASAWDSISGNGVYSTTMTTKKNEILRLQVDTGSGWDRHQLSGELTMSDGSSYAIFGQRNPFRKSWNVKARETSWGWILFPVANAKESDLVIGLKADGSTQVSGKLGGVKVSASGAVDVLDLSGQGVLHANFAPVVTVQKVKRILELSVDLKLGGGFDNDVIGDACLR